MKNLSFMKKVLIIVLGSIVAVSLVIIIQSIVSIKNISEYNAEHFRKEAFKAKEDELKNYVSVAIKTVESYYARTSKEKIKGEVSHHLQDQTNMLFSIITKQYELYKGKKSKSEIKKIIKTIINETRYGKNGYFWINDMDARIIDHPIKPSLNGKALANFKDKNGKRIFSEFVNAVKQGKGSGFVDYVWPKPGYEKPQLKVSFVKLFKPFNWVIGTGAYVDDVSAKMKQEALKAIGEMRYGKSGYFWINDKNPTMIMHPIKPALNGKSLKDLKDVNGVYLFKEMVTICNKEGEGLVKYTWQKPGKNEASNKFSYVKEFKQWEWIIGTGAYIDDIEKEVELIEKNAQEKMSITIMQMVVTAVVLMGIMMGIISLVSTKFIVKPIDEFQKGLLEFFRYLNKEQNDVKPILLDSKDEIGKMAEVVNRNIEITKYHLDEDKALIEDVKRVVNQVNKGIIKQKIEKSTSNESLEELKQTFNQMLESTSKNICEDINKITRVLDSYARLDFTDRVEKDKGAVAKGLNDLANIINEILAENKSNGLTLDKSSDILLNNVDTLNKNSNEAAAALEETAASLEEITGNISSNTENIVQMNGFTTQLANSALDGEKLANDTTISMDEINEQVMAINDSISVIDQIAFQTNILSLNAAVEAATAGEAGKGFAVVAGEVRNLASRSSEAAKEIKELVENATEKANNGKIIVDKMRNGYQNLNENIVKTIELISDIETSSQEQLSGIEQINMAIAELDQQTQKNASIASNAHEVAVQTDKIAKLVVSNANEKEFIGKDEIQAKELRSIL